VEGGIGYFIFLKTRKRDSQGRKCQQSIGDRQFVSFIQFFLHKYGEVTLGHLHIPSYRNENDSIVIVNEEGQELPLAVVPIPENVKKFNSKVCTN
jgi:hypothetical protein